jgi:hypothetical protein
MIESSDFDHMWCSQVGGQIRPSVAIYLEALARANPISLAGRIGDIEGAPRDGQPSQ